MIAHAASSPSVMACRGSAVRTTAPPCGRGRSSVSRLSVAPRMRSNPSGQTQSGSATDEPWNHTTPRPLSRTNGAAPAPSSVPG